MTRKSYGVRSHTSLPAAGPVLGSLGSAALTQVALVLTGVVAARSLGPSDRGYLALIVLVPTVLHIVGAVGLPRAVTYFVAKDARQEESVLRAIRLPAMSQVLVLTVLQMAIFAVLLSDDPSEVKWAGVVALPLAGANLVDLYAKAILQGQRRYVAFNVLRNAGMTFYLAGVLLLVAAGETHLLAFTVVFVVANVLSAIVTLSVTLRERPKKSNTTEISRAAVIRYGLRGYLVSLSPIGVFRLDQALVGLLLSPKALGLYVVGLAFTNLPTFISRSIGLIAFPQVASSGREDSEQAQRFFWFALALSGCAVLALELSADWLVPLFFGSEFESAVPLTRILLVAAFLDGARRVLTETSGGSGLPGLGSIAELTSWAVLVPALAVLMPVWQERGVALATTISAAASLLVLVVLVRRNNVRGSQGDGMSEELVLADG